MQIHPPVRDTDALQRMCALLAPHNAICLDTEFMRENTYYPELCLVQLASPEDAFVLDPLAEGIDLAPFYELLANESVLKVVHAGGQDLEIFVHLTGAVPQPLFDTQIAAMALGMGEQVSYASLVAHFTGTHIDKGARFTDWARRPLSDRQLQYAVGDVTYLMELFPDMLARLRKTGRGVWLNEEMARLCDASHYIADPETAWQKVKCQSRKPEVLGRLKALARWREEEAARKNLPRGRIIRDEALASLAAAPPADQAGLARVRGLSASWGGNAIGQRLMQALAEAQPLGSDDLPDRQPRTRLSADGALIVDLLKLLLKVRAKEAKVAPRLIAHGDELAALADGARAGLPVLSGWRYDLFGREALELMEGQLGFSVSKGSLRMRKIAAPAPAPEPAPAALQTPAPEACAVLPPACHRDPAVPAEG